MCTEYGEDEKEYKIKIPNIEQKHQYLTARPLFYNRIFDILFIYMMNIKYTRTFLIHGKKSSTSKYVL